MVCKVGLASRVADSGAAEREEVAAPVNEGVEASLQLHRACVGDTCSLLHTHCKSREQVPPHAVLDMGSRDSKS